MTTTDGFVSHSDEWRRGYEAGIATFEAELRMASDRSLTSSAREVIMAADRLRASQRAYLLNRTQENGEAVGAAAMAYDKLRAGLPLTDAPPDR